MNEPHHQTGASRHGAFLIAGLYAAFATLWILLSDSALKLLIQDAGRFAVASVLKGWFFVAVTTLLLYGLLRRFDLRPANPGARAPSPRFSRWWPFGILALTVIGACVASIAYHWQQQRQIEFTRLQNVAELRIAQISDWLEERQHDAEYLRGNVYFAELFRHWLQGDTAAATHLQTWMSQYGQSRGLSATVFFDPQGRVLWASPEINREVTDSLSTAVQRAALDGSIQRIGPYRHREIRSHLDWVIPIAVGSVPSAAVVLHTDPGASLYPALQKWPGPSASAESLIARRDGETVLYLSDLRHRQNSATPLRLPLSTNELLVAQLLRGDKRPGEMITGVDYRGIPSVGVGLSLPGTDWFLITKKDSTEFYGRTIKESSAIALIGLLVLVIGGTLLLTQQQQAQLNLLEERQSAEQTIRLQAEVLTNITQGVNVVGVDGRLLYVNPAFAAMFGYRDDELLNQPVAILNAPTAEQTAQAMADKIIDALRSSGRWEDDILNRRKDGSVFWTHAIVSSHTLPIWGDVWLSVQHDITASKLAEAQLNQRNAMLERFSRVAIGRELDMGAMKQKINALASELGRDPPYTPASFNPAKLPGPGNAADHEQEQLAMLNLLEDAQTARDQANAMAATLKASEQRLLMAQEGAHVGIWEWDLRTGSVYWSPEYERLYGAPLGSFHSNEDWRSRVHPDDLKIIDAEWQRHINQDEPFEVEFRIRREDSGETRWMFCVGSARRDNNGAVVILSGINIDITDRKQIELALAESELHYRTLTSNLPGVVYRCEVDSPWRVMMISDGVKELTGHQAKEFLSGDSPTVWGDLVFAEDMAHVERTVEAAVTGKRPYQIIYRIRHSDGEIRWILEHGRAIYDVESKPQFLDGVITDMTAQKLAEEQLLARNAELERFNKVTLGREMDIIAMKQHINALSQELGRKPPYNLAFLTGDETGEA